MTDTSIGIVCTSPGFGGLEMNTLKLCQWLKQRGWQVQLLVNEHSPMHGDAPHYCDNVTSIQELKSGASKLTAAILRRWLRGKRPGILFTPYNKDLKALAAYKRFWRRDVKLVYQQHMKVGVRKRDFVHRLRYNMIDLWISPLPYLKAETIQKTTVPDRKIAVIALGLDPSHFLQTSVTREEARHGLAIPGDVRLLGILGRIDPKKGHDVVLQALAHLQDHYHKDYHLLIMGNITQGEGTGFLDHLHELVNKHRLQERVHFRPYHADVNQFYKAIDVFVMPSIGETYGMVTLEAMISRVPVLGANKEGTAALLQDGRFGWLYELDDIDGFCQTLFDLEGSPQKSRVLEEAHKEVLTNYNADTLMETTHTTLLNLLTQQ